VEIEFSYSGRNQRGPVCRGDNGTGHAPRRRKGIERYVFAGVRSKHEPHGLGAPHGGQLPEHIRVEGCDLCAVDSTLWTATREVEIEFLR
jgi:hypothetical protein